MTSRPWAAKGTETPSLANPNTAALRSMLYTTQQADVKSVLPETRIEKLEESVRCVVDIILSVSVLALASVLSLLPVCWRLPGASSVASPPPFAFRWHLVVGMGTGHIPGSSQPLSQKQAAC